MHITARKLNVSETLSISLLCAWPVITKYEVQVTVDEKKLQTDPDNIDN